MPGISTCDRRDHGGKNECREAVSSALKGVEQIVGQRVVEIIRHDKLPFREYRHENAMDQHFLAQTYQSGFTDPNTPLKQEPYVWILDRETQQWKRRAPKNFAAVADLHTLWLPDGTRDDSIESDLSKIEGAFARAMRHNFRGGPLAAQARADIATFLAALLVRVPRVFRDFVPAVLGDADMLERLIAQLPRFGDAFRKRFGESDPKEVAKWFATLDDNQRKAFVFFLTLPTIPANAKLLYDRTWIYALTAPDRPFITSDTPVLSIRQGDVETTPIPSLDDPAITIVAPLSATVAVICVAGSKQASVAATDDLVEEVNNRILWQSRAFVLTSQNSFLGDYDIPVWGSRRPLSDKLRARVIIETLQRHSAG